MQCPLIYEIRSLMLNKSYLGELHFQTQTHLINSEIKANRTSEFLVYKPKEFLLFQDRGGRTGKAEPMSGAETRREVEVRVLGSAFRRSVLPQKRGYGAGLGDLLGERALHIFDKRVRSRIEEKLYDVCELTR